jgi:hypothetical protein
MDYRKYIEANFLIDEPKTGQLVPFIFRPVQNDYYNKLVEDYDIENKGISAPVREIILKARREGFSSFILALFAADDIMNVNPTETLVISYRDDATNTFRKRYRLYVLSAFARDNGVTVEEIQQNPEILDQVAHDVFSVDGSDIEMKHNKAHFYCGTASARVGGRGGVLQKLLFSEEAHYPDTDKMKATEVVDGTIRQIDIAAGWVFRESTANGYGNYYEQTWALAIDGGSRFKPRFYGWRDMYSDEEFATIASEFTDKKTLKQEYPETPEEAFIASGTGYFDNEVLQEYVKTSAIPPIWIGEIELVCGHKFPDKICEDSYLCDLKTYKLTEKKEGRFRIWDHPSPYQAYFAGGDTAEGKGGDNSVLDVMLAQTGQTACEWVGNDAEPYEFSKISFAIGMYYNWAFETIEANKDGLYVNDMLFKYKYPNMYFREEIDSVKKTVTLKLGFLTGTNRDYILSGLRTELVTNIKVWINRAFLSEGITFVRGKSGKPEAMTGKKDDRIMAKAIGLQGRHMAPQTIEKPANVKIDSSEMVIRRLAEMKDRRSNRSSVFSQDRYY